MKTRKRKDKPAKAGKGRVMWHSRFATKEGLYCWPTADEMDRPIPVLVLDASEAAHEARVDKAHAAIAADPDYKNIAHHQWLDLIHTVLRAIGDTPVKMEDGK